MEKNTGKKIRVEIDPDLEDLIPGFLANRTADAQAILLAAGQENFEKARVLGHTMKGVGSGYGFAEITKIGAAVELAAKERNTSRLTELARELQTYLENVELVCQ